MYTIINKDCKNKQYHEEHQYRDFFHETLCIVNIIMTSLETSFRINKNYHKILFKKIYLKNQNNQN